jgi:hypothetical protein
MRVPQSGVSGWIVLSYENGIPVCTWITAHESYQLKVCLDERLFCDTVFRAERVKNDYIISDIWLYNSTLIFKTTSFRQRYDWLKQILNKFYKPFLTKFIHKSEFIGKARGYEYHTKNPGDHGIFAEALDTVTVIRTEIPDVYTVEGKEGYLRVPNLKTSVFLRSKGDTFKLRCIQANNNWEITENIPELK